jgi:hypothetical protein
MGSGIIKLLIVKEGKRAKVEGERLRGKFLNNGSLNTQMVKLTMKIIFCFIQK